MSVNPSQILHDAKLLVTRLQEDDKKTDSLLRNAQFVSEKINCLKEYKDDLLDLHESRVTQRPRSVLVHNLQQENRQIRILQEENRQLKMALDEHQVTLDVIMQRYRQQVVEMIKLNKLQQMADKAVHGINKSNFIDESNKLVEFAGLFDQCLKGGEEASAKDLEEITRLKTENQTLRQLLKIASQNKDVKSLFERGVVVVEESAAAAANDKEKEEAILPPNNNEVIKEKSAAASEVVNEKAQNEEVITKTKTVVSEVKIIEKASRPAAEIKEKTTEVVEEIVKVKTTNVIGKLPDKEKSCHSNNPVAPPRSTPSSEKGSKVPTTTPTSKQISTTTVNSCNNSNNSNNPSQQTTSSATSNNNIKPPPRSSSQNAKRASLPQVVPTTTPATCVKKSSSQDSTLANGGIGSAPTIGTPLTITTATTVSSKPTSVVGTPSKSTMVKRKSNDSSSTKTTTAGNGPAGGSAAKQQSNKPSVSGVIKNTPSSTKNTSIR